MENTCSEPFTTTEANGNHNAGTLQLTLGPKPEGDARYSITEKSSGGYKLTLKCVREIGEDEFSTSGDFITKEAKAKGVADAKEMITEIALPSTLKSIGKSGLAYHNLVSGTLTIPRNVETLADGAFQYMASKSTAPPAVVFETGSKLKSIGASAFYGGRLKDFTLPENLEIIRSLAFFNVEFSPPGTLIIPSKVSKIRELAFSRERNGSNGITALDIRSDQLLKPDGAVGSFPLEDNLFRNVTGINKITLPRKVYDHYIEAKKLRDIFGETFTKYFNPDDESYNFDGKS